MERVHYLGGVGVQSHFEAIAVQTVTLLAMHVWTVLEEYAARGTGVCSFERLIVKDPINKLET